MQKKVLVGLLTLAAIAFQFRALGVVVPPPVVPPPGKSITLKWDYPANELSQDIVFNVYATTNLDVSVRNWPVITNVTSTSCALPLQDGARFFTVSASNTVTGAQTFAQ